MNYVCVRGGTKKERQLVEHAIQWSIKKLLPRVRTLEIEARLTKCNAYGYCLNTDDHKTFELEFRKGMSLYDLISTVCHEMVHVKQYYRKEMDHDRRWKSRKISEEVSYENEPWEKEAFRMEEKLAMECFKELAFSL